MSVNLNKNKEKLQAAFNDVVSESTDTYWAVFGYEGKSYDLKVVETSDGDLEELVDEMNGGKILYAVIRIKDPNTQLHKTVWINWSGEGVPSSVKGACANHVATITKFFRSTHVTINARSEDDLDEATILAKVAKSSGSNYSIHKEKPKDFAPQGPVGSVYKKTNPRAEIDSNKRDQFWTKSEQEESQRRARETEERKRAQTEAEKRIKEREVQEAQKRDKITEDRGEEESSDRG